MGTIRTGRSIPPFRAFTTVVVLALLATGAMAHAATYYVNGSSGNDANTGTSSASAWRTIQKAANSMPAGNTCLVAPGTYNERVTISRSGTASAPLIFKADGAVVTQGFTVQGSSTVRYVVIDGFEITMPRQTSWDVWGKGSGVALVNTQYCTVQNTYIHHTLREGVMVFTTGAADSTNSSYNIIRGNRIAYAGAYAGITLNGAAQLIENNDISHTIQHPLYPTLSTAGGPDADGIKFHGRDHIFRGNHIHSITMADTGNVSPHIDAFQTFGPAYNILIEGNTINLPTTNGTYQAAMISQMRTPTRDLTFRNNVITAYRGLNIWGINDSTREIVPLPGIRIENNTFYGVRDYDVELHDCPSATVKNNVISATGRYMWTNSGPTTSHNAVPGSITLRSGDVRISDPKFVDAAGRNFRLQATSPLIDAGTHVGITSDLDGTSVPQGSAPDIGAFEFSTSVGTNPADTTPPVITLLGSATVTVSFGTTYSDAGATASDNVDGNITSRIVATSNVNTAKVGAYNVTYNVKDSAGNAAAPVVRTVNVVDTTPPVIALLGSATVTVSFGTTYTDAGATASDNVDGNITSRIVATSNVNTAKVGTYNVTYNVKDIAGNSAAPVARTVNVVDTTPPVIALLGSATVSVSLGATYTDAGATASDNVDGNITSRIVTTSNVNTNAAGTYTVTYNVKDNAGNAATPVVRTVVVQTAPDTTPPVITLLGSATVTVSFGATYTDAGATASDNVDGDITSRVVATSNVNTAKVGAYTVTYNVKDNAGNAATPVVRAVNVVDTTPPVITLLGSATVTVTVGTAYTDADATASDNVDGTITSRIVTTSNVNTNAVGTYTVTYNVKDNAGNAATPVVRTVVVQTAPDTTPPVITLLGSAQVTLTVGAVYTDAGATASDNVDGDITSRIVATSTVNTYVAGNYTVVYNVKDNAGNAATPVTRYVKVEQVIADANTYYVNAATGNDLNSGLSPTAAWKTIQKAANSMPAGNTCLVAPGTYAQRVTITRSGTASAPLVFKAAAPGVVTYGFTVRGSYVQIDGFEITIPRLASWDVWGTGSGVALINTKYCTVKNNYVHHTLREGVMVYSTLGEDAADSSYNVISANRIEYAGAYAGITLNGMAQLIEYNDISHTVQHPLYPTLSTAGGPDADGIKFGGRNHVIRGNHIHSITMDDYGNVGPHVDAFQTFGPAYDILIEGNTVNLPTGNAGYQAAMISQMRQPTRDITFRNNVITAYRGLNIWGINDSTREVVPLPGIRIENNTFHGVRDYDIELHDCPSATVRNNAISATGRYMWTNSSPAVSHNAVPGNLTLRPGDLRVSDHKFVDPAKGDFRLKPDSPLVDAGAYVGVEADFDGTPVPQGGAPDIGAFEFVHSSSSPAPQPEPEPAPVLDTTPPVITLIGSSNVRIPVGSASTDPGATAYDDVDGDITGRIVVSGTVNTSVAGTYTLTYNVSDTAGNAAKTVTRTVRVVATTRSFR